MLPRLRLHCRLAYLKAQRRGGPAPCFSSSAGHTQQAVGLRAAGPLHAEHYVSSEGMDTEDAWAWQAPGEGKEVTQGGGVPLALRLSSLVLARLPKAPREKLLEKLRASQTGQAEDRAALWKYLEGVQSKGKRRVSTTGPLLTAIADFLEGEHPPWTALGQDRGPHGMARALCADRRHYVGHNKEQKESSSSSGGVTTEGEALGAAEGREGEGQGEEAVVDDVVVDTVVGVSERLLSLRRLYWVEDRVPVSIRTRPIHSPLSLNPKPTIMANLPPHYFKVCEEDEEAMSVLLAHALLAQVSSQRYKAKVIAELDTLTQRLQQQHSAGEAVDMEGSLVPLWDKVRLRHVHDLSLMALVVDFVYGHDRVKAPPLKTHIVSLREQQWELGRLLVTVRHSDTPLIPPLRHPLSPSLPSPRSPSPPPPSPPEDGISAQAFAAALSPVPAPSLAPPSAPLDKGEGAQWPGERVLFYESVADLSVQGLRHHFRHPNGSSKGLVWLEPLGNDLDQHTLLAYLQRSFGKVSNLELYEDMRKRAPPHARTKSGKKAVARASKAALVRFEEESSFLRCLSVDVRLFGMVLQRHAVFPKLPTRVLLDDLLHTCFQKLPPIPPPPPTAHKKQQARKTRKGSSSRAKAGEEGEGEGTEGEEGKGEKEEGKLRARGKGKEGGEGEGEGGEAEAEEKRKARKEKKKAAAAKARADTKAAKESAKKEEEEKKGKEGGTKGKRGRRRKGSKEAELAQTIEKKFDMDYLLS